MNILFVADVSIAKVIGGAERFLYELSTRMSDRGHHTHILTRRLPEHTNDHEVVNGVHEWRYDCNQGNPAIFLKSIWSNANRLFRILHEKYHFDCINFHQPFSAIGINSSEISNSIPKFYTCHSLSFEEFSSRNVKKNGMMRKVQDLIQIYTRKGIERSSLHRSDEIIVLSKFTEDKLSDTYNIPRSKIQVIPCGVDLDRFYPDDNTVELKQALNIPHNKVVFLTVRNLVQRMGLENLIIAFNELVKKFSDIQLVIGGEGPLENLLSSLAKSYNIEDKINFTGLISEDQLPLYYQMADLFVLPTKELEGFGLVTLEAMASGLPVIATPIGGTKEILGKFNDEFLFIDTQPDSIAKLATEKYLMIKNNPQRWKQISKQCRKFVEKNYSWKQNIDSFEQLIQGHKINNI